MGQRTMSWGIGSLGHTSSGLPLPVWDMFLTSLSPLSGAVSVPGVDLGTEMWVAGELQGGHSRGPRGRAVGNQKPVGGVDSCSEGQAPGGS